MVVKCVQGSAWQGRQAGGAPLIAAPLTMPPCGRVRSAKVLDLDSLCIEEGRSAWAVCVDVVCVSYDGNMADAALLALVAALRDVRVPKPVVADDGAVTIDPRACYPGAHAAQGNRHSSLLSTPRCAGECTRLSVRRACAALTCCVVAGTLVVDPTAFEEEVAETSLTVVRAEGRLVRSPRLAEPTPLAPLRHVAPHVLGSQTCGVRKYGGTPLAFDVLHRVSETCDAVLDKQLQRMEDLFAAE